MKKKVSLLLVILVFLITFCACSNGDNKVDLKVNSKVIATVGGVNITQQQLDFKRNDSTYSGQGKVFSDKEVLEDLIDEQVLLIKAKELNINMSDNEVKENYKGMLKSMSYKQYVNGDEEKIDKNSIEGLRNVFILQKIKEKLGTDTDQSLKQLRKLVKIKYYN